MPAWVDYRQATGTPPKCVKRGMKESKVHLEKALRKLNLLERLECIHQQFLVTNFLLNDGK